MAVVLAVCIGAVSAAAQMFGDEDAASSVSNSKSTISQGRPSASGWSNRDRLGGNVWGKPTQQAKPDSASVSVPTAENKPIAPQNTLQKMPKPPAKVEVENPEDYLYKNVPQLKRPTLDGVKRGTVAVYPVSLGEDNPLKDETSIFLFYNDFSVSRMMGGTVSCDVKFLILTTLNRKLNNLSVRLRWPNMETTLSFSDVPPNQPMHYFYTLLGDGCYSMDKVPNIIVNRCRVKGLSQQDCAAKVRWLKK